MNSNKRKYCNERKKDNYEDAVSAPSVLLSVFDLVSVYIVVISCVTRSGERLSHCFDMC